MSALPHPDDAPDITDDVERISKPVASRIDSLLSGEINRWSALDPSLADPLNSLYALVMGGGKRLRPAFCYWAFVGAGGDPMDPMAIDAGAALELLHSFALVHDDVMDDSRQRRGADAVHVQFEKKHQQNNWGGEARRFGEGVAILVGDMAFVYADHLMTKAPRQALDIFTEMRIELNIGQYLDVSATVRSDASLPMAQKIAQYKSGKYTVERPLHLGAALADRFEKLSAVLSAYGTPVGEAFQLRDDLLGAFGDSEATGKPVGGDLREGKPTALLAVARERATGNDATFLAERYGAADLQDDEIQRLLDIFEQTGAKRDVETTIEQLVKTGLSALDAAPLKNDAEKALSRLARFVAGRHH
jgi:geranylgeranyl diphosphate synthase type I